MDAPTGRNDAVGAVSLVRVCAHVPNLVFKGARVKELHGKPRRVIGERLFFEILVPVDLSGHVGNWACQKMGCERMGSVRKWRA